MALAAIGTSEGYDGREVVFDSSTDLSWFVHYNGVAVLPSSPSLILNRGNSKTTVTPTAALGSLSYTVTVADLAAIGITQPGHTITAFLSCSITAISSPLRFKEYLWSAPMLVFPSLNISRLTTFYPELADSDCLPEGQTSWQPWVEEAWVKMRNWQALRGRGRMMWMIENPQSLVDLHFNWTMMDIGMTKDADLDSDLWEKRWHIHHGIKSGLQKDALSYFNSGSASTWGDLDDAEHKTLEAPNYPGRHNRARSMSKL